MPKQDKRIEKYETKKGVRYRFKTYLGTDETGKAIKITRSGFLNYKEAKESFDLLRAKGLNEYVKAKQIKLDDLFQIWFDTYKLQVKESTAEKTRQVYINHLHKYYGNTYVDKIQQASLQKFVSTLPKELVNFRDVTSLLNRIFKLAISLNYISNNPLKNVIIPKKTARKRRDTTQNFYDKNELKSFLKAAQSTNYKYYVYFLLLASTGIRKGEALALTWKDINFSSNYININKTLAYGLHGKYVVQPPKTAHSKRKVPLSKNLKSELLNYQKQDTKNKYLFHTENGDYLRLTKPQQWLKIIYRKNPELKKITIHGFRHTFASILIESNPSIKPTDVQAILGHETVQMTLNIYTHATQKGKEKVLKQINDLDI